MHDAIIRRLGEVFVETLHIEGVPDTVIRF